MFQIIRAIANGRKHGDKTEADLIFANVGMDDSLLRTELERLSANDQGIRVFHVLNDPPLAWEGGVGFVTADMVKEQLPTPAMDVKILMCRPLPLMSAMKKVLESLGYDKASPVNRLEDQVFCF